MPRILIADCWPTDSQRQVAAAGAPFNATLFEQALRLHAPDVVCTIVNIADDAALPAGAALDGVDGVILTGSTLHIGDRTPAALRQIEFARAVFATPLPVWGSCWGLQLAAVALGGTVRRNPNGREIGVARAVTLTEAGRAHPVLAGRPPIFDALCTHLDEVETPPPGARVLASNSISAVQALAAETPGGGSFYGVQYHPEITLGMLAAIFDLRAPQLAAEGFGPDDAALHGLAQDYRTLEAAPDRRDLAWRYGIGPDVLDPLRRTAEFGAWLRTAVVR